jgi:hypothetical protein
MGNLDDGVGGFKSRKEWGIFNVGNRGYLVAAGDSLA